MVRLKLSCLSCGFEIQTVYKTVVDWISFVAVCYNKFVLKLSYSGVNDKAWVFHLGCGRLSAVCPTLRWSDPRT